MNNQWSAAVFLTIFATMLTPGAYTPAWAATDPNQKITVHVSHHRSEPNMIETALGRILKITLINEDKITPHNFTLKAKEVELDIDGGVILSSYWEAFTAVFSAYRKPRAFRCCMSCWWKY